LLFSIKIFLHFFYLKAIDFFFLGWKLKSWAVNFENLCVSLNTIAVFLRNVDYFIQKVVTTDQTSCNCKSPKDFPKFLRFFRNLMCLNFAFRWNLWLCIESSEGSSDICNNCCILPQCAERSLIGHPQEKKRFSPP